MGMPYFIHLYTGLPFDTDPKANPRFTLHRRRSP